MLRLRIARQHERIGSVKADRARLGSSRLSLARNHGHRFVFVVEIEYGSRLGRGIGRLLAGRSRFGRVGFSRLGRIGLGDLCRIGLSVNFAFRMVALGIGAARRLLARRIVRFTMYNAFGRRIALERFRIRFAGSHFGPQRVRRLVIFRNLNRLINESFF